MTHLPAPPPDTGIPPIFLGLCGVGALLVLAVVIGVEALVFRKMLRGGKALRDSVIVNIASTLLGVPLIFLGSDWIPDQADAWVYALLLATWAISVAVEAGILRLMERGFGWRTIVTASVAANLISYLLLFAALWASIKFT